MLHAMMMMSNGPGTAHSALDEPRTCYVASVAKSVGTLHAGCAGCRLA